MLEIDKSLIFILKIVGQQFVHINIQSEIFLNEFRKILHVDGPGFAGRSAQGKESIFDQVFFFELFLFPIFVQQQAELFKIYIRLDFNSQTQNLISQSDLEILDYQFQRHYQL